MARYVPVLIVEHDIDRVLSFCQEVTVMNEGQVLINGTPEIVRTDRKVQEIYTGTGTPAVVGRTAVTSTPGELVLQADNLHTARAISSMVLHWKLGKARSSHCSAGMAQASRPFSRR
jgi:ABC-type sugar transport system ATPase subunit